MRTRASGRVTARWIASIAVYAALACPAPAASDRALFVAGSRCAIEGRLLSIHLSGPRDTSKDRFLVVAIANKKQLYVQCIFIDADTRMLCEASSGFYRYGPQDGRRLQQSAASEEALRRLGFTGGQAEGGNFRQEIALSVPPNLAKVADLMLAALHDAYDASSRTYLDFQAPLADRAPHPCPIRSR